ncbi:glycosyltransferase family 4 protein [Gammaproteobacteria bacterium]|nr:glycosyltransferase family 4 protein [Gammaproteobacteria bacterium]
MNRNIVIVVSALNMGGAQRVVSILANYWSKKGYAVKLICTHTDQIKSFYSFNKSIDIVFLQDIPYFKKSNFFNLMWKLFFLRKELVEANPDVIISFLTRVNVATALACIGLKASFYLCERSWPPFRSLSRNLLWLYKILFKNVTQFIVQTETSKLWFNEKFSFSNVKLIPNPVSYPLTFQDGQSLIPGNIISDDKKLIIACGRLHAEKQFDLLIKAFSKVQCKFPDWRLVILGEGEEKKNLYNLILAQEANHAIYLPGATGNMSEWYERGDLFVLSSKVEGFPNALLEAMVYGLPCISFDCDTGPRDMIQDGFNGLLVNPQDYEVGLEKALDKLISDKELRVKLSKNSVLLGKKYSVDKIMKEWNKVLGL